ncbi:MAG: hypothetical protein GY801_03725 [bacterium]|nr:hypothetical protein [bacterium]
MYPTSHAEDGQKDPQLWGSYFGCDPYAAIEVFAFAAHFFVKGHALSRGDYQAERLKLIFAPPVQPNPGKSPAVLHPYLGYVEAPSQGSISEFGFFGDTREAPLSPPKTEHNIIAGAFGGSFANEMTLQSKDILREKIQQIPRFRNKEIIIHTLALRGYKQPQQASALMYFLLLGGYFDMVINLDGFNEVAMSPVTNLPNRVNPFFPKNWFWKVSALKDLGIFMQLDKMSHIKKRQQLWAEIFANSPLRHSLNKRGYDSVASEIGDILQGYYSVEFNGDLASPEG